MSATLSLRKKIPAPVVPKMAPSIQPAPLPVAPVPIDSQRFFICWNARGARPRMRHASLEAAAAERARIMAANPDSEVFIFECLKVAV